MKFRARFILGVLFFCYQPFAPKPGFAQDTLHCVQIGSVGKFSQLLSSVTYKCEPGFASERDLVLIATSHGIPSLESYKDLAVDEKTVYIFDAYADGTPNLIILFTRTRDYFIASLYDDQNNDGQVSYSLINGEIVIDESPYWTMQVISIQPWMEPSGIISYNLDLWVDGRVNANWLSAQYLPEFSTDGRIDFYIKVRDTDQDGSPNYEIRQSYQTEDYWYVPSTWLGVSEQRQDPPIKNSLIWPYLGSGHFDFFQQFNNFYAPIQMDWMKNKIATLVEFVPSHEGDDVWYMQSLNPFGENNEVYANFENPVCWIDLAEDHDGIPELHIRQEYYGVEDQYHWHDIPKSYKNDIRYTWDQNNDQSWDYKIGLSGSYPIDQSVSFPEFTAKTIPCKQFPEWITSKRWGPAVFVASYVRNFAEGIYEWGTVDHVLERYLFGYEKQPNIFTKLSTGYRGEYTYNLNERPWLYLHPIDHMLHLKGSDTGFYQISDRKRLNYIDQDSDGYVDHWSLYESDNVLSTLAIENDYAIYYDYLQNKLLVKQLVNTVDYQTFLPPRNHKEWDELAQKLGDNYEQGDINLQAWILETPGVLYAIEPVILRSFRSFGTGIRFDLTLLSDLDSDIPESENNKSSLPVGDYVLHIDRDQDIHFEPGGSAILEYDENGMFTKPGQAIQLQPVELAWLIHNEGNWDAPSQIYTYTLTNPVGSTIVLTDTAGLIPAHSEKEVSVYWYPLEAGNWEVDFKLGSLKSVKTMLSVIEFEKPGFVQLYSLPDMPVSGTAIVLVFWSSLVLFGGAIFIKIVKNEKSIT